MPDTESAPDERSGVSGIEGNTDNGPGNDVESGASQHLTELGLLQVIQTAFGQVAPLEGLDNGLMLKAFLDMALDVALALADVPRQLAHLGEENLAEEDKQRHDQDQDDGQPPVHQADKADGGEQLDDGRQEGRKLLADDAGDDIDIGEEAVQRVAGVHLLLALPLGLQQIGIQALTDDEVHLGVGHALDPGAPGVDRDAGEHQHGHEDGDAGDVAFGHAGCDVHQMLAHPDEREVERDAQGVKQDIDQQGAPDPFRVPVQPAEIFHQRMHVLGWGYSSTKPISTHWRHSASASFWACSRSTS